MNTDENDDEEQEIDFDRYRDPYPKEGRVVWVGELCCTRTNEAW